MRSISSGSAASASAGRAWAPSSPRAWLASRTISGTASQASSRAKSASGWKRTPQALPWRKAWCSVCAERARSWAPVGQVEDVAVPVQDGRARGQGAEDRVVGVEDLDRGEADLRPLPRPHLGPERSRQQLRAEADAEHRHLAAHRLGQPLALGRQLRVALDFVDVHRPAHHDRAGDLVVVGQRLAGQRFDRVHVERRRRHRGSGAASPRARAGSPAGLDGRPRSRGQASRATVAAMRSAQDRDSSGPRLGRRPATGDAGAGRRRDRRARGRRRRGRRLRDRAAQRRPPVDRQGQDRQAEGRASSRSAACASATHRRRRVADIDHTEAGQVGCAGSRPRCWHRVVALLGVTRPAPSAPTPTSAAARSSPTRPPALPANAPSLPNRGGLEPGHLQGARRPPTRPRRSPTSTPTAATSSTPTSARRAHTASPTRSSAPASASCRSTTPPTATRATAGRSRSPTGAPVEGGNGSDGDRHVLVVDRSSCILYELYRAFSKPAAAPTGTPTRAPAGTCARPRCVPTPGPRPTPPGCRSSPAWSATTRSPPASLDHAIRVTFDSTRNAWVHPASHCAGDTSNPNAPAMGTRLRLKAGYGLGGFSGGARVIAEALKRYGMIVADNGSNWFFSGSSDRRWDDENLEPAEADPRQRLPGRAQRRPPARLLSSDRTSRRGGTRRRAAALAVRPPPPRPPRPRPSPLTSTTSVAGIALQLVLDRLHDVLVADPRLGLDAGLGQRRDGRHQVLLRALRAASTSEAQRSRKPIRAGDEHQHVGARPRRRRARRRGDPRHVAGSSTAQAATISTWRRASSAGAEPIGPRGRWRAAIDDDRAEHRERAAAATPTPGADRQEAGDDRDDDRRRRSGAASRGPSPKADRPAAEPGAGVGRGRGAPPRSRRVSN